MYIIVYSPYMIGLGKNAIIEITSSQLRRDIKDPPSNSWVCGKDLLALLARLTWHVNVQTCRQSDQSSQSHLLSLCLEASSRDLFIVATGGRFLHRFLHSLKASSFCRLLCLFFEGFFLRFLLFVAWGNYLFDCFFRFLKASPGWDTPPQSILLVTCLASKTSFERPRSLLQNHCCGCRRNRSSQTWSGNTK